MSEDTFQCRVAPWMMACFGEEISRDWIERNHRFLEEALELVQANGCTRDEAHQLVDYVFNRPVGVTHQEVGGVMVTLAALCLAIGDDMHKAGINVAADDIVRAVLTAVGYRSRKGVTIDELYCLDAGEDEGFRRGIEAAAKVADSLSRIHPIAGSIATTIRALPIPKPEPGAADDTFRRGAEAMREKIRNRLCHECATLVKAAGHIVTEEAKMWAKADGIVRDLPTPKEDE